MVEWYATPSSAKERTAAAGREGGVQGRRQAGKIWIFVCVGYDLGYDLLGRTSETIETGMNT